MKAPFLVLNWLRRLMNGKRLARNRAIQVRRKRLELYDGEVRYFDSEVDCFQAVLVLFEFFQQRINA